MTGTCTLAQLLFVATRTSKQIGEPAGQGLEGRDLRHGCSAD